MSAASTIAIGINNCWMDIFYRGQENIFFTFFRFQAHNNMAWRPYDIGRREGEKQYFSIISTTSVPLRKVSWAADNECGEYDRDWNQQLLDGHFL